MLTIIAILVALILLTLIASQISVEGKGSWAVMLAIIVAVMGWLFWPK